MDGRGLIHGLAQDRADGAGAAPAFRAAAETAIDLGRGAGAARTRLQARAYLSVGEDVARADNHAGDRNLSCLSEMLARENRRSPKPSDHSRRSKPPETGRFEAIAD